MGSSFAVSRSGLLSKVSLLLAPSLAVSAMGTYVARDITSGWTIFALGLAFFFGDYLVRPALKISKALGFLVLMAWVFESGMFIGPSVHQYVMKLGWQTVFDAYIFTGFAMCALGAYGFLSKRDFSGWLVPITFALLALIVVMLIGIFVSLGSGGSMLISLAGMAIFSILFIIYFNMMANSEDNWFNAFDFTIVVYLAYMNMLLFVLQLLGLRKD